LAKPIEPFYVALGRRIFDLRVRKGWTQQQLGERLAPPQGRASIANIETGKQRVLAHTLTQLARVLDVSIQELVPESQRDERPPKIRTAEQMVKQQVPPAVARELMAELLASPNRNS
jgi:transcriptional regulator with XRE-family HTH domain